MRDKDLTHPNVLPVFLVYATIAPVTSFFLFFCFILSESGYRYQYIHNYPKGFETGGQLFRFFIQFTLASIIIAELTILGLLYLKQSFYAGPAMGPLLTITILFTIFINGEHARVSLYLPTRECVLQDEKCAQNGQTLDFVVGAYLQPALRNDPCEPEYEDYDEVLDLDKPPSRRSAWRKRFRKEDRQTAETRPESDSTIDVVSEAVKSA